MDLDHANPLDSATNHSTVLKAITWLAVVTSFFFMIVRTGLKWTNTKKVGLDDLAIHFAFAFCIAASVCLTLAANEGFGNADTVLDDRTRIIIEKYVFAFNVLFFLSLGSSMLSLTDLIYHISPVQRHRNFALGTGLGIGLWTLIATLAFSFQCHPNGVDFLISGQCIDRSALYTSLAILNLFLEVSLVLQPTIITWHLNMSLSRRITVITCFLGRLAVILLLAIKVVVIWHRDMKLDILLNFGYALTTILILNVSIITACTPYLRPFFVSLHTAQMGITELPYLRTTRSSQYARGSRTANSSVFGSNTRSPLQSAGTRSKRVSRIWQANTQDLGSDKSWKFERLTPNNTFVGKLRPDDTGKRSTIITTSQVSDNRQDPNMGSIEHTIEFSVEVETIPKAI